MGGRGEAGGVAQAMAGISCGRKAWWRKATQTACLEGHHHLQRSTGMGSVEVRWVCQCEGTATGEGLGQA